MADDTAALMDALDIKKAHVCGLSMGGMMAMEFALRHPGRLDRMILTGAPGAPARAAFHPVMTWNWGAKVCRICDKDRSALLEAPSSPDGSTASLGTFESPLSIGLT